MLHGADRRAWDHWWDELSDAAKRELCLVVPEILGRGASLREVWDFYLQNQKTIEQMPLGDAISSLVVAKSAANRRKEYLRTLGGMLRQFAHGRESMLVSQVSATVITDWLTVIAKTPESRGTWINRLNVLFEFSIRHGWCASNPVARVDRVSIERVAPEILSVRRAARVMIWTKRRRPELLAWMTLALMAGLRPEEADKTSWAAVNLKRGYVEVAAGAAKVRARRLVYLMPAAAAWLKLAKKIGSRLPVTKITRRRGICELRSRLGYKAWPKDLLRHTCASMLLAEWQDAGKVANALGNSPGVLLTRYKELVDRDEAKRFWGLSPRVVLPDARPPGVVHSSKCRDQTQER